MSSLSAASATRIFWPTVALLLAYLCAVQVLSSLRESTTADESVELAAGYSYVKLGDFRMEPEQPPLLKILAALSVVPLRPSLPQDPAAWYRADQYVYGLEFLRTNADRLDTLLLAARLPAMLLTGVLGLAIAIWTRSAFGPAAALLALTLYAFDPTITAHGRYVKNDLALTLFSFLACIAWGSFLMRPSARRLLWAALALGLALATKFSALFLLPVAAILYAVRLWQGGAGLSWRRGIASLLALAALSGGVVSAIYELPALLHGTHLGSLDTRVIHDLFDRTEAGVVARATGAGALRVHPFVEGLVAFLDHNTVGHPSYLLGMHGTKGWWYYFPVALVVKTPLGTLGLIAIAVSVFLRELLRRPQLRRVSFWWFVLAVPLTVFGAFSMASHLNIGIRHLLPIWPCLFILSSAIFLRARFRHGPAILLVLLAGLIAESVAIFPHYLAFFNVAAGGAAHGPAILLDSNVDWGQDAKNLSAWLGQEESRAHSAKPLCLDFFGTADLDRLGLHGPSLLAVRETERREKPDCLAAISVNLLYGLYAPLINSREGEYVWLRSLQPVARIGYSIYVYDFSDPNTLAPLEGQAAGIAPGFLSVMHQDFRGPPTPGDPAQAGEILACAMTGLGPVLPPVAAGRTAPLSPLSRTLFPITCRWDSGDDGPPAEVLFAGLAPGRREVYQVNVRVAAKNLSGRLTCGPALAFLGLSRTASIDVPVAIAP